VTYTKCDKCGELIEKTHEPFTIYAESKDLRIKLTIIASYERSHDNAGWSSGGMDICNKCVLRIIRQAPV
jgi:hypothetical protein